MKPFIYASAAFFAASSPAWTQGTVPTDMAPTCVVAPDTFAGWFPNATVTANGLVNAPDSVTFSTTYAGDPTVCDFYSWGAQMFLWLTSPAGSKHVLDSSGFFTISPAADGTRTLIANSDNSTPTLRMRREKSDALPGEDIGEIGQAGSAGVLMSQDTSLVYYGLHANDGYAYFLSGQKTAGTVLTDKTQFPSSSTDLDDLKTYLAGTWPDVTLQTGNQLAMELKTSWVEAGTLSNPGDYITITGTVPNFVANADNTEMTVDTDTPSKTVELALTGMHVVGTVQDHPEFIWATFEHVNNAPDAPYYYLANDGTITLNGYDSDQDFLFMARGGAQDSANTECMKAEDGAIKANMTGAQGSQTPVCAGGIVPSDTVREYPWGSLANDPSSGTVTNNTLLLSINNSVRSQLAEGDVRHNYIQTGSVWTTTPPGGGQAPIPNQVANQALALRGSTSIANMTMETYTQGTNCFSCHNLPEGSADSFVPRGISHVYSEITALSPAN